MRALKGFSRLEMCFNIQYIVVVYKVLPSFYQKSATAFKLKLIQNKQ